MGKFRTYTLKPTYSNQYREFNVGEKVEVFSESAKDWFNAEVIEVCNRGVLQGREEIIMVNYYVNGICKTKGLRQNNSHLQKLIAESYTPSSSSTRVAYSNGYATVTTNCPENTRITKCANGFSVNATSYSIRF